VLPLTCIVRLTQWETKMIHIGLRLRGIGKLHELIGDVAGTSSLLALGFSLYYT